MRHRVAELEDKVLEKSRLLLRVREEAAVAAAAAEVDVANREKLQGLLAQQKVESLYFGSNLDCLVFCQ